MTIIDTEDSADLPDPVALTNNEIPPEAEELAEQLVSLIRSVKGVTAVYSAEPLAVTLANNVVNLVTQEPTRGKLVGIRQGETDVSVTAVIGTDQSEPAGTIGRRVHTTICDFLTRHSGTAAVKVFIKIARVH